MGWKVAPGGKAAAAGEKLRLPASSAAARSRMKLWVVRATTTVLLWTCVVQLTAVGDTWGPRVLKGWPSCLTAPEEEAAAAALPGAAAARPQPVVEKAVLPPKSESPRPVSSSLVASSLSLALFRPAILWLDNAGPQLDIDSRPALWLIPPKLPRTFPRPCMKMTGDWCGFRSFSCAEIGKPGLISTASCRFHSVE